MQQDIAKILAIQRELNLRNSRENFWAFCVMLAPDFYKEDRWHLHLICEVLQALYERRLTKEVFMQLCRIIAPQWYVDYVEWNRLQEDYVYVRLIIDISPRHGKSRTLVLFCDWMLGKSGKNKIIEVSYNSDLAGDFSRYVRDTIMTKKNVPTQIVFSDIFPNTRISKGNASFFKWALEGFFFNYLGSGL